MRSELWRIAQSVRGIWMIVMVPHWVFLKIQRDEKSLENSFLHLSPGQAVATGLDSP